jgi:hypothetical protein
MAAILLVLAFGRSWVLRAEGGWFSLNRERRRDTTRWRQLNRLRRRDYYFVATGFCLAGLFLAIGLVDAIAS